VHLQDSIYNSRGEPNIQHGQDLQAGYDTGVSHLDSAIQVEYDVCYVICVVNRSDPTHDQCMVCHATILDETPLGPELLQGVSDSAKPACT